MNKLDELIDKYEHCLKQLQVTIAREERFQTHIERGLNGVISATLNVSLAKEMEKLTELFIEDLHELKEEINHEKHRKI